MPLEILPNEPIDLSTVNEKLRPLYGDGMPVRTYRTDKGTIVRYFQPVCKTPEETRRAKAETWRIVNQIADNCARRAYEAQKGRET